MKQYRVALLRKEFPFVDRLFVDYKGEVTLSPEKVDDIKIKKGDRTLLGKKGDEDSYTGNNGNRYSYTKYFAVWTDAEGEHIFKLNGDGYEGDDSGEEHTWTADTIGEQLFVKSIAPDFIIECTKNDGGNDGDTRFWTIYKMKRFDLSTYHQEMIDRAAATLKAEIAAACE